MTMATKLIIIAVITISFIVGILVFYITGDLSKKQKKKYVEEIISQLINIVIFIWIGKVLIHFPAFIKDPLAILAYPSNSFALYFAILCNSVVLVYKAKRKKIDLLKWSEAFLFVVLVASFSYEFIQIGLENNRYSLGYLILLSLLLIVFLVIREKISTRMLLIIMLVGWSIGLMALTFIYPFITVFGYTISPWFIVVSILIHMSILMNQQRKWGL